MLKNNKNNNNNNNNNNIIIIIIASKYSTTQWCLKQHKVFNILYHSVFSRSPALVLPELPQLFSPPSFFSPWVMESLLFFVHLSCFSVYLSFYMIRSSASWNFCFPFWNFRHLSLPIPPACSYIIVIVSLIASESDDALPFSLWRCSTNQLMAMLYQTLWAQLFIEYTHSVVFDRQVYYYYYYYYYLL